LSKIGNLLPHASVNSRIGLPFLVLSTVDSTNNYAMGQLHAGLASHGQAYFALHQFAGKGQRGKTWNAAPGENITISIVLHPDFPNNQHPFLLSMVVSLSCIDLYKGFGLSNLSIKWPNDIYWGDRKAGGILIENVFRANEWKAAIVGIGLNINQTLFPQQETLTVSLKQITGQDHDPITLAKQLCLQLEKRYNQLFERKGDSLLMEYNSLLYKKGEVVKLKKGTIVFETTIDNVSVSGDLHTKDAMERNFAFGEVEWLGQK
jgi:BirA family biotin operon repressor/biotin-[acetyl-CoA-carboxylase] ligase